MKTIADRIPGSRYHVMPGGPHMLFIEQPEETAQAVGGFLKDVLV
jgi:pimeloyl-ACP methyl ester carboxylesterase